MSQSDTALWFAIAGLGALHGLNPAMGWLFAVALGLHRQSRGAVFASLAPILVGHAAAVSLVLFSAVGLSALIEGRVLSGFAGLLLLGWAAWHIAFGHRYRVRVGMRTGLAGLGLWSFAMASAHGAGVMLLPFALPLCAGASGMAARADSPATALAVIGVHTAAMTAFIAVVSIIVYEWAGLSFLRRGWLNIDLLWSAALALSGLILLITA